ncbi:MAG: citrate lyase subunit alpha, partial [Thermoplasmata archaeon]
CDDYGNCNGRYGKSAFGAMGYAYTDTVYAEHTVVITDNIQPYPVTPPIVQQTFVDYIVKVDSIGDPSGIQTGTLRITRSPARLKIAREAINVLAAAGILKNGVSIQAGAGGISLAATKFVHEYMKKHGMVGSFVMGGTTKYVVDMLREGTMMKILDGQTFDLAAIESLRTNPMHVEINNTFYADIHSGGCAVDKLDAAFLGGTEIDINFNVNVNTHSDGKLLHGIGGHQDVAAGAGVTILLMPTVRGRIPTIRKEVTTVTTPGETVDVLVTERGVAVNPRREDLIEDLKGKVPLVDIEDLYKRVRRFCKEPREPELGDEIVAIIEYRDGTVIDVVRAVKS